MSQSDVEAGEASMDRGGEASDGKKSRRRAHEVPQGVEQRRQTFSKRKKGMVLKAAQLSLLTNSKVFLFMANGKGHSWAYATPGFEVATATQDGVLAQLRTLAGVPETGGRSGKAAYTELMEHPAELSISSQVFNPSRASERLRTKQQHQRQQQLYAHELQDDDLSDDTAAADDDAPAEQQAGSSKGNKQQHPASPDAAQTNPAADPAGEPAGEPAAALAAAAAAAAQQEAAEERPGNAAQISLRKPERRRKPPKQGGSEAAAPAQQPAAQPHQQQQKRQRLQEAPEQQRTSDHPSPAEQHAGQEHFPGQAGFPFPHMPPGPYSHAWHPAAGYPPYGHFPGMSPHSYPPASQPPAATAARPPGAAGDAQWPSASSAAPGAPPGAPGFWPAAFPGYGHLPYGYPPGAAWQMAMQHGAARPGMPSASAAWASMQHALQAVKAEPGAEQQRGEQEAVSSHVKSSGASQ